jgi:hypothetical protein
MRAYGGCSTDREVADRLGNQLLGTLNIIAQVVGEKPLRYVSQRQLDQSLSFIGVAEDNLFLWLCQHFDRQTVIDAYKRLLITPALLKDGRIATQFWFMTRAGDICHDKLILYKPDGKRDHDYGGGRWFTTALGFGHRCYFGEHLGTDGDRFVVESEKTALLMWLNSGTTALATGGAKNLRRIKRNYILCPDYDEAGMEWIEKFPEAMVSKWWEFESGVQKGDDLGDVIYRRLMAKGDKTV